jgi:hypothetical protein
MSSIIYLPYLVVIVVLTFVGIGIMNLEPVGVFELDILRWLIGMGVVGMGVALLLERIEKEHRNPKGDDVR